MPVNNTVPFYLTINQVEFIKYLLCAQYCQAIEENQEDLTEYTLPKKSMVSTLKGLNINQRNPCKGMANSVG